MERANRGVGGYVAVTGAESESLSELGGLVFCNLWCTQMILIFLYLYTKNMIYIYIILFIYLFIYTLNTSLHEVV